MTPTYGMDGFGLPAEYDLTLRLDEQDDGTVRAIVGADGSFGEGTFLRSGTTLSLAEPLQIPRVFSEPCGGGGPLAFDALDLRLLAYETGGDYGGLSGSGSGSVEVLGGDVIFDVDFTAEVTGEPDLDPPALTITSATTDRNVLDGVYVRASEPLVPTLRASLEGGGETIPLESRPMTAQAIGAFATPTGTVLPFGASLAVVSNQPIEDLGGLQAGATGPMLTTMADPGVFAEDGFEGPVSASLVGDAAVVDGVGSVGPLAGSKSLLVPPGSRFTAVLPIDAGDTAVHMSARLVAATDYAWFFGDLQAGVAGAGITRATGVPELGTATPTGDADWPYVGDVGAVEIPLPAGASGQVVVDLRVDDLVCGPVPDLAGILVDDLRVD